jgi:hypothetical protein
MKTLRIVSALFIATSMFACSQTGIDPVAPSDSRPATTTARPADPTNADASPATVPTDDDDATTTDARYKRLPAPAPAAPAVSPMPAAQVPPTDEPTPGRKPVETPAEPVAIQP